MKGLLVKALHCPVNHDMEVKLDSSCIITPMFLSEYREEIARPIWLTDKKTHIFSHVISS